MIFPTHITSYKAPGSRSSSGENYSLDYSGLDEIRKRQNEASATSVAKYKALYDGKPDEAVMAGRRIRDLLGSISSIEPVRMSSYSSNSSSDADGAVIGGDHADLKYLETMAKMPPAPNAGGGGGSAIPRVQAAAPPQSQPRAKLPTKDQARVQAKFASKPGYTVMAGDPETFPYLS